MRSSPHNPYVQGGEVRVPNHVDIQQQLHLAVAPQPDRPPPGATAEITGPLGQPADQILIVGMLDTSPRVSRRALTQRRHRWGTTTSWKAKSTS
jgi:hypothetical protein